MSTSEATAMVREFHETFGHPVREMATDGAAVPTPVVAGLRVNLIAEELEELREAFDQGDIVAVADALADLEYVVRGAALVCGVDLDACLREVHRSNMSKLGEDGKPIWREDGKVLKGPAYFTPDLRSVLFGE